MAVLNSLDASGTDDEKRADLVVGGMICIHRTSHLETLTSTCFFTIIDLSSIPPP